MSFGRRLRTYLVGFLMGLILVYFVFGDRVGDWLPENRILLRLATMPMEMEDKTSCLLECHEISNKAIKELFNSGEVLMDESQPRNKPNSIYMIEAKNKSFKAKFETVDSTATRLLEFIPTKQKDCSC